jgi:hypothetical protein
LYCNALDQELENQRAYVANYTLVLGHKFIEPLNTRRLEHEKARKSIKTIWAREQKRVHEALSNLRKARDCYVTRRLDLQRARHALRLLLDAGSTTNTMMNSTAAIYPIHSTSSASSTSGLHSALNSNLISAHSNIGVSPMSHVASSNTSFPSSIGNNNNNNSIITTNVNNNNHNSGNYSFAGNAVYSAQLAISGAGISDVRSASTTCSIPINSSASDSSTEQLKIERKRRSEEEAVQKALEAETAYKYAVMEANERLVHSNSFVIIKISYQHFIFFQWMSTAHKHANK